MQTISAGERERARRACTPWARTCARDDGPAAWFRKALLALCAVVASSPGAASHSARPRVVSWAENSVDWNSRLGVEELRLGCSSPPEKCLKGARRYARQGGVNKITISMKAPPDAIVEYARQYALASDSGAQVKVIAISIDDFVRMMRKWQRGGLDKEASVQVIEALVGVIKRANPELKFAITLYEDELGSELLRDSMLRKTIGPSVDRVSLYLHYRENVAGYHSYVREVRRLFPRAEILAGVYAYDRRDYLPCSQRSRRKCTVAEELALFEEALRVQTAMVQTGELDGFEFYPGHFGLEGLWKGWSNPEVCEEARRAQCVDLTLKMRASVVRSLSELRKPISE